MSREIKQLFRLAKPGFAAGAHFVEVVGWLYRYGMRWDRMGWCTRSRCAGARR
jgi:hypothetical protein